VNSYLFGLTALGALLHLAIHTLWLSLITMFFRRSAPPCTGALAQSKPIARHHVRTPGVELQGAMLRIRTALDEEAARTTFGAQGVDRGGNRANTRGASDWHLLVRPHNLPLA